MAPEDTDPELSRGEKTESELTLHDQPEPPLLAMRVRELLQQPLQLLEILVAGPTFPRISTEGRRIFHLLMSTQTDYAPW